MARLYRPHIPLSVRVQVAERQVKQAPGLDWGFYLTVDWKGSAARQLESLLRMLARRLGCEVKDLRLDHDPALCNRKQFQSMDFKVIRYVPAANDPNHLIYRTRDDHDIKTRVRGPGAQFSDLALLRREKKRQRPPKPKKKWASKPFPKSKRGFR